MKCHVLINEKTKEGKELLSKIKTLPESTARIVEEDAEGYLIPADKIIIRGIRHTATLKS